MRGWHLYKRDAKNPIIDPMTDEPRVFASKRAAELFAELSHYSGATYKERK